MPYPEFPFEVSRREGRLTRPIMCRRCAKWTAFDGTQWRHPDGSPACVDPGALYNNTERGNTMTTTRDSKGRIQPKTRRPQPIPIEEAIARLPKGDTMRSIMEQQLAAKRDGEAPLVENGELTEVGKAALEAVKAAVKAPVKKLAPPTGLSAAQKVQFDRAAPAEVTVPKDFNDALELIPPIGVPFASPQDRTTVVNTVKRAYKFFQDTDVQPEIVGKFNEYINHTESRTAMSTTKKSTTPKAPKTAPTKPGSLLAFDRSKGRAPEALIAEAVAKALAEDPTDISAARREHISDGLRAQGYVVNGKAYVAPELKRQHALLANAGPATEQPSSAVPNAETPTPKASKPRAPKKSLERDKVTPIPKKTTSKRKAS